MWKANYSPPFSAEVKIKWSSTYIDLCLHGIVLNFIIKYNNVTCMGDLDWMIGLLTLYTFTTRDYRPYSAIADLHTFSSLVTHPLGFSVFTSSILATDL
jgi:hypothetical protein